MSYSGAFLFGSGAALASISLLVERSPGTNLDFALPALATAFVVTIFQFVFPELVPVALFPWLAGLGTVLIGLLAYSDAAASGSYSLLYVWVALYSCYFFSLRTALLEMAWVSIVVAVELSSRADEHAPISLWIMTTGTCAIGGLAIRQLVIQVRRHAAHDDLTGLYNRRRLHEELYRDLRSAERSGEPLTMLMIDLDKFKEFNDAGGHLEGDRHLREVAERWSLGLRSSDLLARFGGDEFVVLMPGRSIEQAVIVADRLRRLTPNGQTSSAGAVQWDGAEDALSLISRADAALYLAKVSGRNRTTVQLIAEPAPALSRA